MRLLSAPLRNSYFLLVLGLVSILAGPVPLAAESLPENGPLLPPVVQLESSRRLTLKQFRTCAEDKSGLILDARWATIFRKGHVPGALSLPSDDFDKQYAQLKPRLERDKAQKIVVYCSSLFCKASEAVQKKLIGLGFTQVYLFPNGWAAWQQAHLPEEKADLKTASGS